MAKKTGLDDMFDDGSMTFGEHIEELRRHLWRAIVGILIATTFTIFFAQYVVKILVAPLEGALETWHFKKLERVKDQFKKDQELLPPEERQKLALELTLAPEELTRLAALLGVPKAISEPITLHAETEAYRVAVPLSGPMLTLNRPWDIRTMSVPEALVIYFKAALGAAVILSSPWVFFQIYSFVAVGLYSHERRFVRMTLPFCTLLFLVGVAFCYFVMLPVMVKFLLSANDWMGLQPDIRLNEWVGFCVLLMIVFGGTFQLPILMLTLERVGIITYEMLASKRRIAFFGILIFAAIATPTPDPLSQALLAIPVYGLFELGLVLMRRGRGSAAPAEEGDEERPEKKRDPFFTPEVAAPKWTP